MAKYKVTANSGLYIRSGPSTATNKVSVWIKGTIFVAPDDEKQGNWVKISSPSSGWACLTYLQCVEPQAVQTQAAAAAAAPVINTNLSTGNTVDVPFTTITPTIATEDETYLSYIRAYGCPPQFTTFADPPIYTASASNNKVYTSCGRVYSETLLSSPSLLSISPCNIKYLPGWSSGDKDAFFTKLVANIGDSDIANKIQADNGMSGKLYEAVPAYNEYMNHYNVVCRAAATFLGIGDVYMPGTSIRLREFDYSYYTTKRASAKAAGGLFGTVIASAENALTAPFTDNEYLHFFLNQSGTSVQESISTDVQTTAIEDAFSKSGIDSITKNISLLTGFTDHDTNFEEDVNSIFNSSDSGFLKSFASMAGNYLKGGRLVFPKLVAGSNYEKAISASCTFISPYANKLGVFLYCMVPAFAIFCLTIPKQLAEDMYSIPYLCRIFQKGAYNSDLSCITGLDIKRGGDNDTAWTVDGLSTIWECSFSIVPMYNKMMIPSAQHPFMAFGNSALLEYLGVMCGINLNVNNIDTKIALAKNLLIGAMSDRSVNLGRKAIDYAIQNSSFTKFLQFVN